MTTVRQRRELSEGARLSITKPQPEREKNVYLVTSVRTTTSIDPETGEPVAKQTMEASIQDSDEAVETMLLLKKAGDDRLASTKAFRLKVDPQGRPTIGSERRAIGSERQA